MLDLIFTRQLQDITNINYGAPLLKSDQAVLDINGWAKQCRGSYNYKKERPKGLFQQHG